MKITEQDYEVLFKEYALIYESLEDFKQRWDKQEQDLDDGEPDYRDDFYEND
jgi:hypothetical protein